MAISPTSDLILDVARAADPQKAQATTRALASASSGDAASDFARALDGVPGASSLRSAPVAAARTYAYRPAMASAHGAVETAAHKAAVGLESVLLKNFVDQMLPKDAVGVFGGGVAGDVWKSMLSEKIANEVAKSGSLHLASRLFATHQDLLQSHTHKMTNELKTAPPSGNT